MLHATAIGLVRGKNSEPISNCEPPIEPIALAQDDGISIEEVPPVELPPVAPPRVAAIEKEERDRLISPSRSSEPATSTSSDPARFNSIARAVDSATPQQVPYAPHDDDANDRGSWTFRSTPGVDLKLGDKSGALARDMRAHGELDLPPKRSAAGIVEGLDAIDVERGFGRGGAVVQAIEEVVRDPSAPPVGIAFFDVAIDKSGKVSVSVAETTADREDWQRLTNAIAENVKTKSVRIPEQSRGLRIGVRVEAKVRFPDGRDPRNSGTFAEGTGFKAHADKDGLVIDSLPEVSLGVRGKVCDAAVSLTLLGPRIGGGCSPENIGTHPERTVTAREVSEQRM